MILDRSLFKTLSFFLLANLIGILILECFLRILLRFFIIYDVEMGRYALELKIPHPEKSLAFVHRPEAKGKFMGVSVRTNKEGWRDQNHSIRITNPDKKRVMFLGDSITFGWGVPEDKRFSNLIQHHPDLKDFSIEVFNLGHGNYNVSQSSALFRVSGKKYRPDLVVFNYFINDAELTQKIPTGKEWLGRSRIITLLWSRLRHFIPTMFGSKKDYITYYKSLYTPSSAGWLAAKESLIELKNNVNEYGGQLIVTIIPDLHSLYHYPFSKEHDLIKGFLKDQKIRYYDLLKDLSVYENSRELWVSSDDAHPNEKAHQLISNSLAPFVQSLIRKK